MLFLCFVLCFTSLISNSASTSSSRQQKSHSASTWQEVKKIREKTPFSFSDNGVWPLPQQQTSSAKISQLVDFRFVVKGSTSCGILEQAIQRYYRIIFGRRGTTKSQDVKKLKGEKKIQFLNKLYITLNKSCSDSDLPDADMDEHYEINIRDHTFPALLIGNTVWGALRGLETFSQLVWKLEDGRHVVNQTQIVDWPRFQHRGILLDTSRHFISKDIILQNLEAMAMNKYNVFHWHIVDDQSFPYQSAIFPDLSTLGAWEPYEHVYTQEDIAEIIEFARVRGIRVVAEFDTPGHSLSWGYALSKLLTPCYTNGTADGTFGPINPILNSSYDTLQQLFTEVLNVFPDTYVHLGGDEVDFSCWKSNPAITQFMAEMKFGTDYAKLEEYYIQTLVDLLEKIPTKHKTGGASKKHEFVVWQEVFDNQVVLDMQTIVHVWKDTPKWQDEIANVTQHGHRSILSSCWYLNYISYGDDWKNYYQCDPQNFNGTNDQKTLVVGGETCMWGEYIDNTNILVKMWPRASAVAERLWSNESITNLQTAEIRLRRHRCLMDSRGIPAEPNLGPDFCMPEYDPHPEPEKTS